MADGSITFSTKLDNGELEEQLQDLNREIEGHEKALKGLEKDRAASMKSQEAAMKKLTKAQEEYAASQKKLSELQDAQAPVIAQVESVQAEIQRAKQESGNAKREWLGARGGTSADQDMSRAQERVTQLEAEYNRLLDKIQGYDSRISEVNGKLEQQKAAVDLAASGFEKAKQETAAIDAGISNVQAKLASAETAAGGMVQQLRTAAPAAEKAGGSVSGLEGISKKVEEGFQKVGNRIKGLALNSFVFSLISKGFQAIAAKVKDAVAADDEASASFARLKSAMLTAIQPILSFVVPILTTLANVLTRVITLIGNLFGKSFFASNKKAAKALDDKKKAVSGVGAAAKEASKYLAGFDELNVMNDDTSGSGGGGGGTSGIGTDWDFDTKPIKSKLEEILTYFTGPLLLALGAVLTFTGANIPLGLGLMVIGGLALAAVIKENWETIPDNVGRALTTLLLTLGAAALVIGAILTFTGANIPLGISLMIIGAAAIAGAHAVAVNWNSIKEALAGPVGEAMAIASGIFLVLGLLLVFSGTNIPLGIGMIIASTAALVTWGAVNWNFVTDKVKEIWESVKNFWSSKIAPVFTIAWWQEKFSSIGDGLKSAIKRGINAAIGLMNTFIRWINAKMHFQWGGLNIGGLQLISPGQMQLFTIPNIPYLAQGAVIPPNREFLAVLGDQKRGTNVEAPLETIKQAVAEVISGNDALLREQIELLRAILERAGVYIDGRKLADYVTERQRWQSRSAGGGL